MDGKIGFKKTMIFMINMVKKSLQLELNDFFETILKKMEQLLNKLIQKLDKRFDIINTSGWKSI